MRPLVMLAGLLAALALAGCDSGSSTTATTAAASTATYNPDSEKLPVAADYEERAERLIDKQNYKAELDRIDKLLPRPAARVVKPPASAQTDGGARTDGGAKSEGSAPATSASGAPATSSDAGK